MLNLRQIEVFQSVMDQGGITRAAEHLNVSQPSVSKTIKHLETQLGLQLFIRYKSRLVPTPEASALYEEVAKVYEGLRSIKKIAEEMKSGRRGKLRVAASGVLGMDFLPKALSSFLVKNPGIRSSVVVRHVSQVEELLASQQVDLGLVLFPSGSPSVDTTDIGTCKLVCVVDKDHEFNGRSSLAPTDLVGTRLICYDAFQPLGRMVEKAFHSVGLEPDIGIHVELCSTACSLARYSGGIAIVDEFTASAFPDLTAIPFTPELSVAISLLSPSHRPSSMIVQDFVEHLKLSLNG